MTKRVFVQGSSWQEAAEDAQISCALPNQGGLLNDVTGFRLARTSWEDDAKRAMLGTGHDFESPRPERMSRFNWLADHNGMYTGLRLAKEKT